MTCFSTPLPTRLPTRLHTCLPCRLALLATLCVLSAHVAAAQISLQTAVDLALRNSPKVRSAQADLDKASAARDEARDAYVPQVITQAGYGQSTGAPLGVPIIFSISAQSLVFSFSQRDYIRAARESMLAAEHALHARQIEVVEDATNTYLALDNAAQRKQVSDQEIGFARRLVQITEDRVSAGVDARVELPKSRRTATQIRIAALVLDDEIAGNRQHLATLTGLPIAGITTDSKTIPAFVHAAPSNDSGDAAADGESIQAAFATARARQYSAFGDHRYLLRPQISLLTNYSRVDTGLSSYASYYPRFQGTATQPNSQNSLSFGLQISVPLLDLTHRSRARESAADAARALSDAEGERGLFREGRAKLQHATAELELRAELARDDQEIAQDQLETLEVQMQASAGALGGPQVTPREQLNAQLLERQRRLDMLTAELQLRQTQVNLLRQNDSLGVWIGTPPTGLVSPIITPGTNTPAIPGTAPSGTTSTPSSIPMPTVPRP